MYKLTKLINGFTVTFSASFEGIDQVCRDAKRFMAEKGLEDLLFAVIIGAREALTNAVRHGSKMDPQNDVFFSMEVESQWLRIRVTDSGPGFDWRQMEKACASPTDSSGRGICILGQYFDSYSFNQTGNQVELMKKINE